MTDKTTKLPTVYKSRFKRILAFLLAFTIAFMAFGCKDNKVTPQEKEVYEDVDYSATHTADDKLLHFASSDSGLDRFLNDYFERHMRYSENRIHTHPVGAGGSAWKEWESLAGAFWDSSTTDGAMQAPYATNDLMKYWLENITQDKQGYVFQDLVPGPTSWGMGWAFPSYYNHEAVCFGAEFNDTTNKFTAQNGTIIALSDELLTGDKSKELNVLVSNKTEFSIETPELRASAFHSPYLKMGWGVKGAAMANIDDIYIYWQTNTETSYSESRMVKLSEISNTSHLFKAGEYNASYIPMYLRWGIDENTLIKKIKLTVKSKDNKPLAGNFLLDFFRAEYDDRQANNLGMYITSAKNLLAYTRDKETLTKVLPRARKAMQYYLSQLKGNDGLVTTNYMVGHDCLGYQHPGQGIGHGFWDVLGFPDVNLYVNLVYYRSLQAMQYLELLAADLGVDVGTTQIANLQMDGTITYAETAESLQTKMNNFVPKFSDYFWSEKTERFVGGYYGNQKISGKEQDFGYLMFNLEAVDAGLASGAQSEKIMQWLTGERIIEGDTSKGNDIYLYELSSRFSTKQNVGGYCFEYGGIGWGLAVQNGGAVLQQSYYDITARNTARGADSAYSRLKGMQTWYDKVSAAGGKGWDFYRDYYKGSGITLQGGPTGGPIGVDYEFIEAAVLIAAMPDAFFGLEPNADGTLTVKPSMPKDLKWWRMENLSYGGAKYDLAIGKYFVELSGVSKKESATVKGITVKLKKPTFEFKVYYKGEIVDFTESNGYIVVNVPFADGKVEIKG